MNPVPQTSSPAFPKLIRLPEISRPAVLPVLEQRHVHSAADLPGRLFFGDLVADTFKHEKKGWSAEWRDADGHKTRYRYAGGLSSLELSYAGDDVVTLTTAERFDELRHTVQTIHPGGWLEKLAAELEGSLNLRVFPHREEDGVIGGFPDGHMLTLIMPVAADRVMGLYDTHKLMQQDASLRTGIDAYLRYGFSVVNYIEGRNHPMLAHPAGLVLHHVNALGTPAAQEPEREVDVDGGIAWTLRRSHYVYVAHCTLRDARRFIERLVDAGFIAAAGSGREGYPDGPEFAAALLPYGYEYAAQNAWWFDAARRRRMFYPQFADSADRDALGAGSGDLWIKAMLRDAGKAAELTRADTARAFAEGLSQPSVRAGVADGEGPGRTH